MSGERNNQVISTKNCFFDPKTSTFRLYCGKSLYAFAIAEHENFLEHLYWGPALPPYYDLRYVSHNTRYAHFFTYQQQAAPQTALQIANEGPNMEEKKMIEEGAALGEIHNNPLKRAFVEDGVNDDDVLLKKSRALGEFLVKQESFERDGGQNEIEDMTTNSDISAANAVLKATSMDPSQLLQRAKHSLRDAKTLRSSAQSVASWRRCSAMLRGSSSTITSPRPTTRSARAC